MYMAISITIFHAFSGMASTVFNFFFLVQSPNVFHISAATIMVVPVTALAHALATILSQSLFYCHDKKT